MSPSRLHSNTPFHVTHDSIPFQVEDVKLTIPMPKCVTNVNPTCTCEDYNIYFKPHSQTLNQLSTAVYAVNTEKPGRTWE